MSYGLKIINPSGELVISSDAQGLTCIHKATLVSVTQPSGIATSGAPGRTSGFSTYSSNHGGPIICAIDLPAGRNNAILAVGGFPGSWSIKAYSGASPDANGFEVQAAIDVWVFGVPPTSLGTYALALYNQFGNLTNDLSRANPLYPRAYVVDQVSPGVGVTIPSLLRPVALGSPTGYKNSGGSVSFNHHRDFVQIQVWSRTGTSLISTLVKKQQYEYNGPDELSDFEDARADTPCFILEGNLLP